MTNGEEDPTNRDRKGQNEDVCRSTVTDLRIHHAESALNQFRMNHQAENPDDRYLDKNAQEAMEHALKAVISASGDRHRKSAKSRKRRCFCDRTSFPLGG